MDKCIRVKDKPPCVRAGRFLNDFIRSAVSTLRTFRLVNDCESQTFARLRSQISNYKTYRIVSESKVINSAVKMSESRFEYKKLDIVS